jgi:hypothetical protein
MAEMINSTLKPIMSSKPADSTLAEGGAGAGDLLIEPEKIGEFIIGKYPRCIFFLTVFLKVRQWAEERLEKSS